MKVHEPSHTYKEEILRRAWWLYVVLVVVWGYGLWSSVAWVGNGTDKNKSTLARSFDPQNRRFVELCARLPMPCMQHMALRFFGRHVMCKIR